MATIMKRHPLCPLLLALPLALLHAGEMPPAAGRAHIPHKIPDGSPPPPPSPRPVWRVAPSDILSEKNHRQGGRTITVREIKPIALPPPPGPTPPPVVSPELRRRVEEYRRNHPRHQTISLGATVYRLDHNKTRTHFHIWGHGGEAPVSFWSSGDFSLLAGIGAFTDRHGQTRALFMIHSVIDIPRLTRASAARNRQFTPPEMPALPDGETTFVISKGQADDELLAAIGAIHEILADPTQNLALREAAAKRMVAARAREEELGKNPPQPKNIILNHWRVQPPTAGQQGGGR